VLVPPPGDADEVSDEYTEPLFGFGSPSESRAKLEQLKREVLEAQEPSNTNKRKEKAKQLKRERKINEYCAKQERARDKTRAVEDKTRAVEAINNAMKSLYESENKNIDKTHYPDVESCLALAQKTNRVDWYTFSPTCENLNRKQKRQLSRKLSILQAIFRGNMERKKISEIPKLVQNEDLDQLAMRKKVFRERKQEREAKEKLDKLIAESKVEYESDFVNKRILPGSVGKPDVFPDGYRGDVTSGPRNSRRYNTSNSEMDYNNISKNFAEPKRKIIKEGPFEYIYKNDKNIVDEPLQPMSIYANVEEELKKHNQKISEKLDKFYIADMELYKKIRNIERQKEDKDGFLDEDGKEVELDPEQKEFLEKYKKFKKDNAEGETVIVDTPNNTKYELYIDKNGLVTVLKYIDENGLITDFNEKDEYEDSQDQTGGSNNDRHLFDALENNDLEQMRVAIESGANVNVQNRRGTSPLIFLAKGYYYPNAEIVDLLLTNNADPNLQDRGGETALHWAAAKGYLEIVKKLLESENIDINITNIDGRNALHSIFDDEEDLFDLEHVETIIKLLIEKGININETDNSGKTALHLAAEQNHGNAVGILLRAGADENIKTDDYHPAGQTAYELAENNKNRIELDRHNSLREIIPGGDLVERLRITQIERDLVRVVMTVGEEEHSLQIPRNILVDTDHNLWTYEPLALNAFHEFHREKAQAYLAERGQAGITASYLSEEAKNEDSILNSLPHDLEKRISKMLGGTNKSNRKKFFKDLKGRNSHVKRIISEKYGEDVELAEEYTHVDSEGHYVYKLKFKGNVTNNEWVYIGGLRIANTPKNEDWISIVNNQIINDISNELDRLEIPQVKNFQPKKNSPKKQSKGIGSLQKLKLLETGDRINSDEPDEIKQQESDESKEESDENEAARLAEHARLAAERREEDELAAWVKELEFDSINTKAAEKKDAHIKGVTSLTRADEPPPPPPRKQPHLTALERRRAKKEKLRNSRSGELESPPTPPPHDDEYNRLEAAWHQSVRERRGYEESKSTEPPNPIPEPHTTHSSADLAKLRNQELKSASNRYSDAAKQKTKSEKKTRKKTREKEKKWYRRAEAAEEARVKREREREREEEARVEREREREEERARDAAVKRSQREAAMAREARSRRSALEYETRLREQQLAEELFRLEQAATALRQAEAAYQQLEAQFDPAKAQLQQAKAMAQMKQANAVMLRRGASEEEKRRASAQFDQAQARVLNVVNTMQQATAQLQQAKAQLQQAKAQFEQAKARVQRLKNNPPRERTPRVDGGAYNKTLKEIQELDDEIYHRTDGGGQIFSSNKKDYELEFLNNELSKTRKRYNTYGKLLAVNKLIPKNVDNDIWDYAMKKYKFFKKNYYEFRAPNNVLDLSVHHMEWLGDWIDEETLITMMKVLNILSVLPTNIHYANSESVLEIKQSIEYAFNINSNPQRVLIALLRSQAFLIEYYFFMLNHGISRERRFNITINKLNSIFTEIYKKENYELSLYKTIHENPFLSHYEQREMSEIIDSIIFYKEIATKSLKIIFELFEEYDKFIFVYLKEQAQKNDEIEKEKDKIKMYKLTNRRKKKSSHWSNHYKTNERRLPEIIETKIDENLL
jgi:ankyrin repeat protein